MYLKNELMELTDFLHAGTISHKSKVDWKFLDWAWSKTAAAVEFLCSVFVRHILLTYLLIWKTSKLSSGLIIQFVFLCSAFVRHVLLTYQLTIYHVWTPVPNLTSTCGSPVHLLHIFGALTCEGNSKCYWKF